MVKIITNGVIKQKQKQKPWPYGENDELRCPECGCVFSVEESDGYRVVPMIISLSLQSKVEGVCPFCAEDVRIYEPMKLISYDDVFPDPIRGRIDH